MVIKTQDQLGLVNFGEGCIICVDRHKGFDDYAVCIYSLSQVDEKGNRCSIILGCYKTQEKAKLIVDDIENFYMLSKESERIIYQMPSDTEDRSENE